MENTILEAGVEPKCGKCVDKLNQYQRYKEHVCSEVMLKCRWPPWAAHIWDTNSTLKWCFWLMFEGWRYLALRQFFRHKSLAVKWSKFKFSRRYISTVHNKTGNTVLSRNWVSLKFSPFRFFKEIGSQVESFPIPGIYMTLQTSSGRNLIPPRKTHDSRLIVHYVNSNIQQESLLLALHRKLVLWLST